MHYLGSKTKLSAFIVQTIEHVVGESMAQSTFCDLFAGSGAVSLAMRDKVGAMIANDMEYYSYVLVRNILRTKPLERLDEAVKILLTCKGVEGKIFRHYSLEGGEGRHYFSSENAKMIDALRQGIEAFKENEPLYFCLLASLLECAHGVSNTASVYSAFLKKLKPLALETLSFTPCIYPLTHTPCQLFCEDANHLIERIEGDILYLDPPYNRRQYGANYHLLNTIARYDDITPLGKTGVRNYTSSLYCKKTTALEALEEIIEHARFSLIVLSYNNEGLIAGDAMASMMKKYGKYSLFSHEHERFKSHDHKGKNPKTIEFLHVLEK